MAEDKKKMRAAARAARERLCFELGHDAFDHCTAYALRKIDDRVAEDIRAALDKQ